MARSRPRVVMLSGNAPPVMDGVGDCTFGLYQRLVELRPDWSWVWITRRPGRLASPVTSICGRPLLRPSTAWNDAAARRDSAIVKWLKPDILHVQEQIHSYWETDSAVKIAEAGRASGAKLATTLHEFHIELPSVCHTVALARMSDVIVANDRRNSDRCLEAAGRAADHLWWSANTVVPPRNQDTIARLPGMVATFGFIGGLKSLDVAFEGMKIAREKVPDLRWRIIGPFDPETNPAHREVRSKVRADWVEFTGAFPIASPKLKRHLAESEVMLLPYADGASLRRTTLQAAWAFGLPVVTTPPPAPEPAIRHEENALLIPEPTPSAYADAIVRVLTDRPTSEQLAAGSFATAETFGWKRLAELHLAMYDELLGRRG